MHSRSVQPRRILIVDDEEGQRRVYWRFLTTRGYQVITAVSGADGLEKARTVRPHLALVDIMMRGGMDGIHLLRSLRADPATVAMPVILMTGLRVPESFVKAAEDGLKAGAIYAKGQDLHDLELRIEQELRRGLPAAGRFLRRGRLIVDTHKQKVRVDGQEVVGSSQFLVEDRV